MTIVEPVAERDRRAWPDDPLEEFDIDPAAAGFSGDWRAEPFLASAPYLVEFDETEPLDPERGASEPEELEEFPEPPQRVQSLGLAGSLGVHLLPLLVLLSLTSTPVETGGAIPVQLVLEESVPDNPTPEAQAAEPQAAEPQPVEPTPPAPSQAAPPKTAETPAPPKKPSTPATPTSVHPAQSQQQAAAVTAPASPKPMSALVTASEHPAPQSSASASASKTALASPTASQAGATPNEAQRAAPTPGLDSTGKYLAYLVTLTRQHLDLLPPSVVGGRRGRTVIGIRVLDDGTIAQTRVARTSNYPDIDVRIEQMVVSVGHFPPLPEALRGQNIELDLNLNFPEVLKP